MLEPLTAEDIEIIAAQLQRPPRGLAGLVYRCPCGKPAVVTTEPRLADGTPFPTTYYLTCPRAHAACSSLESRGLMAAMSRRLSRDAGLAEAYRHAHEAYMADRERLGDVPEIAGVSAGGMPDRVKCLHALAAHARRGRGVNPLGDETLMSWVDSDAAMFGGVLMKAAAVDCGTNSLRLLIAESRPEGGLVDLDRQTEIVRLGQGVDATGEFHPDALKRTFAVAENTPS